MANTPNAWPVSDESIIQWMLSYMSEHESNK